MKNVMKNIMITGGRGYIGTNLQYHLNRRCKMCIVDKVDNNYVEDWNKWDDIDCIIHLAAVSGIKDCEKDKEQAIVDNISATFHVFRNAYKYGIPVVFASSGAAQNPENNFYALSKRIGEVEAIRYNDEGANIKILRFANVYGGEKYFSHKKSVIAKFDKDHIMVVNGDGTQTRDFIHVKDVCKAIELAMLCDDVIDFPMGVGTGINTSILDLAKMFNKAYKFNYESNEVGADESPAEVESSEKYLGFKSNIKLEDEIAKIAEPWQ